MAEVEDVEALIGAAEDVVVEGEDMDNRSGVGHLMEDLEEMITEAEVNLQIMSPFHQTSAALLLEKVSGFFANDAPIVVDNFYNLNAFSFLISY